jgi:hypothetical protein
MHFLGVGEQMVERLKEQLKGQVPTEVRVMTLRNLATAEALGQFAPAVYVTLQSDQVLETHPCNTRYEQTWLAIVVVKNAANQQATTVADEDAGAIIDQIHAALNHWTPKGASRLIPTSAPRPSWTRLVRVFPRAFRTVITYANPDCE